MSEQIQRETGFRTPLMRRIYPLPDAILFLYLLCIAREYLWALGSSVAKNVIAWSVSTVVAGLIIWLLSSQRGTGWEATPSAVEQGWHSWLSAEPRQTESFLARLRVDWLWLVLVVAPLLFFFSLRAPFPAFEFDHLNYHLVNTERSLRGWPLIEGDFFPGTLLVNPAPDMAFGVLKYLVGYRLAPILNIGVLLWTANVLNEIIAPIIVRTFVRYLGILFILATDQISYLVNIYMIDLLSLPLLISATLLTLRLNRSERPDRAVIKIALFLGIALAFKLTNAFFVVPIVALAIFELFKLRHQRPFLSGRALIAASLAALLPSIFFFGYMFRQTGNPFFPYYNKIFQSPLMLAVNYHDPNLGPDNLLTKILWPIISFLVPHKLSAMNVAVVYSGRLNLGFILSLCLLCWPQAPSLIRRLSFVTVLGCGVWSFGSGDIRYGLFAEILGGVACCYILKYVYDQATHKGIGWTNLLKARFAFAFVFCLIALQSLCGLGLAMVHFECVNEKGACDRVMQPVYTNRFSAAAFKQLRTATVNTTMLNLPDLSHNYSYSQEARYLFNDREAQDFYSESEKEQFRDVQLWINCFDGSSAYMAMAAPNVPMISIARFLNLFDYMQAPGARQRVHELLRANQSKKMYTIVLPAHRDEARSSLAKVSLKPGAVREIDLPMYSPNVRSHLLLIELTYSEDE
jgi:hypothetical protein